MKKVSHPSVTKNLYQNTCRLSSVKRFGSLSLDSSVSVSEHSYRALMLGMVISDQYNKENPKDKVCVETVMRSLALHDLEEAQLGDLPSPLKNLDPDFKAAYKKLGTKVMKEIILPGSPEPEMYLDLWVNDKSDDTKGQIVAIADLLEGFCTVCYEIRRGNKMFSSIFLSYIKDFESAKYAPLLKKFSLANEIYLENKAMVDVDQVKLDAKIEEAA